MRARPVTHAADGGNGSSLGTAGLRRELGLGDCVAIGLGAIIGAGIFVVLGIAAGVAGPAVLVSLALAGAVAAANALSSAQLAATYPLSGGTYEYGNRVLGPWWGFVAGWMFLASKIAAAGTVALGLGAYLGWLIPGVPIRVLAVSAVALFTLLNYFGVRRTARLNVYVVAGTVGALLVFVVLAVPEVRTEPFVPFAPNGIGGLLQGAALMFFAYTGYARIATLGEEVRDPHTTIPRAIGITIVLAILLYLAIGIVAVGIAGSGRLAATAAPLQVVAEGVGGSGLRQLVSVAALLAMFGVILSQVLGLSRMVFAMARGGDLPAPLALVHPRHDVPGRAVLLVGCIAGLVAATGTLAGIAAAASFAILVYYGIANVAALRMPAEGKLYPDLVPLFGLAGCGLLALSLPAGVVLAGLGVLLAGLVYRRARLRARSRI